MSIVSEAVYNTFKPNKLNLECLGNGDAHLHFHIFPRRHGDTPHPAPVWIYPPKELFKEEYKPNEDKLNHFKISLLSEIDKLL